LLRRGRPENAAYISDFDLLPAGHPKSMRTLDVRAVDLSLPDYIMEAAARGLEYHAAGLSGDGIVDRTIREARLMSNGQVSEDKVIRTNAWAARHLVDLDAEDNRDPQGEGFPGAGAVAFYLWGIDALDPQPAMDWFARKAEAIKADAGGAMRGATIDPMTTAVETRRITVNEFEIRDLGEGDGMAFTGYAAVFNSASEPLPFIERIAPGAFANSLSSRNEIKMFVNHDTTRVLASKRAGTLRLSEDAHGLRVEADLPPTTDGKDLAILMKRGDVDSMSFGFSVPSGGDTWSPDGATRELREVRLHEVSIVTAFPAYTATSAGVRSLDNLAAATGADAGLLDAAITKLEAGETLDDDAAMLIESVVQKLRADTSIGAEAKASLDMKRKQLDLLFSRV
jgi:HK97 family phage prohead protease